MGQGGCVLCCPPITFVLSFTHNKVKIVPADTSLQNVHSGTCIDDIIMDFQHLKVTPPKPEELTSNLDVIYTEPDGKGYDFILVAHGGRMGTSKTVHYRCLLNENVIHKKTNDTTPLTKESLEVLTYHMSYQYSTASKVSLIFSL